MEYSIAGVFNFQMFGIPFVGADICGYNGNATINLCSRWMQLGAFYPFMRNHNSPNGHPQEPYIDDKLADISRKAILTRYSLVRYLYSDYMHVSVEGGIVIRPLLFVFPADKMMYSIMDETFMFGYAIRVTPVMSNNTATLLTYFPNHDWFELDTFKQVVEYNSSATTGKNLTLICSLDSGRMNLHIMGGSIFPYQDEALNGAKTVIDMLSKSIKLVVAPDHNAKATGYLFYDDDTILMTNEKMYHDYKVALENATVKFVQESGDKTYTYPHNDDIISEVVILGKHYPEAKCAKVVEHAKTVRLKVTRKADTLVLTPESDYMMNVQNIDSISWYDTTEC